MLNSELDQNFKFKLKSKFKLEILKISVWEDSNHSKVHINRLRKFEFVAKTQFLSISGKCKNTSWLRQQ